MASCAFLVWYLISGALAGVKNWPKDFPYIQEKPFKNWANDITINSLYTAYPKTAKEVVDIANWARENNYTVRASGSMHTWAPITVYEEDIEGGTVKLKVPFNRFVSNAVPRIIILKTKNLGEMGIINSDPKNASFWAGPGILMDDLVKMLEKEKLGFLATPAPGDITLGGNLAIGGHGTGVPAKGEKLTPGYTYGSMSNLIMGVTAVVYDGDLGKYILKNFSRTDPESKAFMVHLGRTFITNYTMRAGPLQYVQCKSFTNITATELFAHPSDTSYTNTISHFLDRTGRMEVILFPLTEIPWFKIWNVTDKKPEGSRSVSNPYNYQFSDHIPEDLALIGGFAQTKLGLIKQTSPIAFEVVKAGLTALRSYDIWGPARTVHNYIRNETLRVTANGYAIHTARKDVQRVLHEAYSIYKKLIYEDADNNRYPIDGPLEVRVTGVDNPSDVMMEGAATVGIAATSPFKGPDYDTVVWVDVLTFPGGEYSNFMKKLEESYLEQFQGDYASIRVEWSKGWAYTQETPYKNTKVLTRGTSDSGDWGYTKHVLNTFDPHKIFTNHFLRELFHEDNDKSPFPE